VAIRLLDIDESEVLVKMVSDFPNIHLIIDIANVIRKYLLGDPEMIEIPVQEF
jgi:hypothetical protein